MTRTTEAKSTGYLTLVEQSPKLSREQEHELAQRWRDHGDTAARDELVRSQLRHVVTIARRYRRRTGTTLDELIAEGNFGLLQALDKFDPHRGTRFVTYAVYWIRAYISHYLIRSRSLVTTGVQSKLLSKIRRERAKAATSSGSEEHADSQIAERFALSPERLRSLTERLDVRDVTWDETTADAPSGRRTEALESLSPNAEEAVLSVEAGKQISAAVAHAVSSLDARERFVVERRLMANREEELSLAEIGRRLGVSRERARQLETRAMRKLKTAFGRSPAGAEWLAYRLVA